MSPAGALLRLSRPLNVAITGAAVVVGVVSAGGEPWGMPLLAAIGSAGLIAAGGNVFNDLVDLPVDRLNKPDRPLPRGDLGTTAAAIFAGLLLLAGLLLALLLPPVCRLIAVGVVLLVSMYNLRLKRLPLVGNGVVAITAAAAFPFGSLAAGVGWGGAVAGSLAFLFHLPREVIKDLEDVSADAQAGLHTLPIAVGEPAARRVAIGLLVGLLIFLPVPALAGWLGGAYLPIALVGVGVPVCGVIRALTGRPDAAAHRRSQRLLKWTMLAGLLAVLAG